MSLKEYNRKRKFDATPEPRGKKAPPSGEGARFVVQMHSATQLHFDLRLEHEGVFKSWAVPKGPSLNPNDQRLAVFVEDHPLDYGRFEGIIPKGNYGAGTVMIWDTGTYELKEFSDKDVKFVLNGRKLKGEFALFRLPKDPKGKSWLLVKKRDAYARYKEDVLAFDRSVATGRSMEEIAREAPAKREIWLPGKGPADAGALQRDTVAGDAALAALTAPRAKGRKAAAPPKGRKAAVGVEEALPRKLKPMLFTLAGPAAPELEGKGWVLEPKVGGVRAIATVDGKRATLHSRQLLSFDAKHPDLRKELAALARAAVIDGEIAVAGADGRIAGKRGAGRAIFFAYDLLHLDGKSLRDLPLAARKEKLRKLLADLPDGAPVRYIGHSIDSEAEALALGRVLGSDSLVARHGDSTYTPGTSPYWVTLAAAATPDASAATVSLTHQDRVYFPQDGYTKGDLVAYYRDVAPVLLPHLRDRPESLNRHPNGIAAEGFFQKDMKGYLPPWAATTRVTSGSSGKTIDFLLCQNEATLLYMANLGCIELNPWLSRVPHLDRPDVCVIDLDPDAQTFPEVVSVALCVRRHLEAAGIRSFVKTSGATGLHIYLPLSGEPTYDDSRELALTVGALVVADLPHLTTLERSPVKRRGKLYVDCLQNRRGQTLAAPYCVRPRDGAPVSTPLLWSEVTKKLDPRAFTIKTMPKRLATKGDLWADFLAKGNDVQEATEALARLRPPSASAR